jgi:hypothetical protein
VELLPRTSRAAGGPIRLMSVTRLL